MKYRGLRYFTKSDRTPIYNLSYWGDGKTLREKYVEGK